MLRREVESGRAPVSAHVVLWALAVFAVSSACMIQWSSTIRQETTVHGRRVVDMTQRPVNEHE